MINTFELVIKRNEGHFDKKTNCLSKGTILFRTVTWRGERATAICSAAEAECVWQGKRQALSTHFIHANEVLNGKIYSLFQLERIILNTVSFTQYALLTQNRHFHFIIINL